ncbi:MAG: hypothetical protein A2915_03380 [Candidatus Yanofskybacteria bacterium RIFCSPLOWO2_01_FULL_41_34]|uniref:Pyrroloquinoline quinone-dependent pyranose dehydrogenase beta-propeller domain-containing protein n=1 Tax=Candidatus Yanofskybacteria bacterium RIFCSPHIGHO2_01_FULL_41_26 TaxID=1802661 RepID=A0A1F8EEE9_9BACT|nr:MAG: hypothetical protein A2649_01275 [Candidatus Yanofskybacteria bacterium RIFCSPHIGHO2_01_FULL_41_26]OGN21072.1 MAG: hypothetical protein A2915_03380 [Candidatus Yanofskybacteria bacterium RIFCSPLOWO2_01_FULL_41_34]
MFNKYKILAIAVVFAAFVVFNWFYVQSPQESAIQEIFNTDLSFLKLPESLKITIAAKNLDNPRVMVFDSKNRMLVSETKAGRVSVLEDKDKNGYFESGHILIENLRLPHGLDFYPSTDSRQVSSGKTTYLYVAETQQIVKYAYDANTGKLIDGVGKNITNLPADGQHFTRTISFGPNFRKIPLLPGKKGNNTLVDIKLYISVGSSCDVCVEDTTWKRAAILESDPEGSYTAEFAGGLRNSVFFTFHPKTKEIWASEMGRDNLGDSLPPDEINIIKVAGSEDKFGAKRFGWPFCYGNRIKDKIFNPEKIKRIDLSADCAKTEPPIIEIPAHSAPLGLTFIPTDKGWPKEWAGDLLVAFHGSWNRSIAVGYKIVRYDLDANGKVLSQKPEDFISGWLGDNGKISGRPVDLKFGPDGALYVSDDSAGIIYRVTLK